MSQCPGKVVCRLSSPPGNHASQWTGDFWSQGVLLILTNYNKFFFGMLQKKLCFEFFVVLFGSLQTILLCKVG